MPVKFKIKSCPVIKEEELIKTYYIPNLEIDGSLPAYLLNFF